jgi:Tachylectin
VLYAVTPDGKLMVYRHLDPLGGEMRWSGPVQVGTGWNGFAQLFSTGGGVIYGLATDGKLSYYRHLTWNAATPTFKWAGPVAAGQGFNPAAKIVPLLP